MPKRFRQFEKLVINNRIGCRFSTQQADSIKPVRIALQYALGIATVGTSMCGCSSTIHFLTLNPNQCTNTTECLRVFVLVLLAHGKDASRYHHLLFSFKSSGVAAALWKRLGTFLDVYIKKNPEEKACPLIIHKICVEHLLFISISSYDNALRRKYREKIVFLRNSSL